ncbi:hypothetical protein ACH47Z_39745 [Streptomyces sp. NPDC020192]|uniref:hypothetical protein n=1 Tax=Streptomyces sp. NPDC020192 TaxID=3365066 RepID=UPI0037A9B181
MDPDLPYRMSLVWNTELGQCTFAISPSHTSPSKHLVADGAGLLARTKMVDDPREMIHANPLKLEGWPGDTWGGDNVVDVDTLGHKSTPDQLDIGVHGVNSLMNFCAVDNNIKIKATQTSVTVSRQGTPILIRKWSSIGPTRRRV